MSKISFSFYDMNNNLVKHPSATEYQYDRHNDFHKSLKTLVDNKASCRKFDCIDFEIKNLAIIVDLIEKYQSKLLQIETKEKIKSLMCCLIADKEFFSDIEKQRTNNFSKDTAMKQFFITQHCKNIVDIFEKLIEKLNLVYFEKSDLQPAIESIVSDLRISSEEYKQCRNNLSITKAELQFGKKSKKNDENTYSIGRRTRKTKAKNLFDEIENSKKHLVEYFYAYHIDFISYDYEKINDTYVLKVYLSDKEIEKMFAVDIDKFS